MKSIIGLILAMNFTIIGINKGRNIKLQRENLAEIVFVLNFIYSEIYYNQTPLNAILSHYSIFNSNSRFIKGTNEFSGDFPIIWGEMTNSSSFVLNDNDRKRLIVFGSQLGKTNCEEQLLMIKQTKEYFIQSYEEAKIKEKNEKKLYCLMGVFAGLITIILTF